ncbi:MAG: hypothetical protein WBA23_07275 [Tunicatimonas sp.]|uniref:hypothetical protein n=1 Tax=Tunicatimonas sp. TaxID=1940096 RepID=UPI003C72B8AA
MKEVTLRIAEHKLSAFLAFIQDLDYVEISRNEASSENTDEQKSDDFFELAGIWEDRDISAKKLRQKAWPIHK